MNSYDYEIAPDADKPLLVPIDYFYLPHDISFLYDIHLGIPTNILCVDDRLEPKYLGITNEQLQDFTATLYLGKITFKKNKQGNLAPIYTPSKITESSFEGLNVFWLNEINKNAKTPFKSIMQCELGGLEEIKICYGSAKTIPHQKIHYYRSKDNIVLTKEQIISYFTQLHKLNTTFIKNYIDTINKEKGIRAYIPHEKFYLEFLKQGILQENMFKWYNGGGFSTNNDADLIVLDFLKHNNQSNFKIVLFDELFYAYLVWSLKEYLIPYYQGRYQDENDLLLNIGAYKEYINKVSMQLHSSDSSSIKIEEVISLELCFYNNLLYGDSMINMISYGNKYTFSSPNQIPYQSNSIPHREKEAVFKASPLGNYYFQLEDSLGTFIEFFQKLYPSINHIPKHWNKEMMLKLDLVLE